MFFYFLGIIFIIFLDIIFFKFFKKNLISDNLGLSFLLFTILILLIYPYNDLDIFLLIIISINYLLLVLLHYLIFTGIKKTSPSLFIIHQLKRGINDKTELKKLFLKNNFFEKRLNENLKQNLILIKNKKFFLSTKANRLLKIFKFLQTILKIQ